MLPCQSPSSLGLASITAEADRSFAITISLSRAFHDSRGGHSGLRSAHSAPSSRRDRGLNINEGLLAYVDQPVAFVREIEDQQHHQADEQRKHHTGPVSYTHLRAHETP